MERIILNVSGTRWEVNKDILSRHPGTRLGKISNADTCSLELRFERQTTCFESILSFYQTGKLHMPSNICPMAFKEELDFWGVDPANLDTCCYMTYMQFMDKNTNKTKFFTECDTKEHDDECLTGRQKIWRILEYRESTFASRLFFLLGIIVVLTTVATIAFSTLPQYRRQPYPCEWVDFILNEKSYKDAVKFVKQYNCKNITIKRKIKKIDIDYDYQDYDEFDLFVPQIFQPPKEDLYPLSPKDKFPPPSKDKIRPRPTEEVPQLPLDEMTTLTTDETPPPQKDEIPPPPKDDIYPPLIDEILMPPIRDIKENNTERTLQNKSTDFVLNDNSSPEFNLSSKVIVFPITRMRTFLPDATFKIDIFHKIDYFTTIFFTIELILRLLTCPSLKLYYKSLINIIDTIVLLGTYADFTVIYFVPYLKFSMILVDIIDFIKLLRIVRLLRYCQHLTSVRVLRFSIKHNAKDLIVLIFHLFLVVTIFAQILYMFENRKNINSIPQGWWLGIITMTTVGFGDLAPESVVGKIACSICALSGILTIALITPVFVETFMSLYGLANISRSKFQKHKQLGTGKITEKQSENH